MDFKNGQLVRYKETWFLGAGVGVVSGNKENYIKIESWDLETNQRFTFYEKPNFLFRLKDSFLNDPTNEELKQIQLKYRYN